MCEVCARSGRCGKCVRGWEVRGVWRVRGVDGRDGVDFLALFL